MQDLNSVIISWNELREKMINIGPFIDPQKTFDLIKWQDATDEEKIAMLEET